MVILFFVVSLLACIGGSICGIGGGVIIKPVLDALKVMSVSSISCLSGCTVLSMSVVSVYKNMRAGRKINVRVATLLAIGAAVGGITGQRLFAMLKAAVGNESFVGMVQALGLILVSGSILVYSIFKDRIKSWHFSNGIVCVVVGLALGVISSFLGIGGGPINLVALGLLFSMTTKDAALASLYIIMFAQIASLGQMIVGGTFPEFKMLYLVVMVAGGILGGNMGSRINKTLDDRRVEQLTIVLMAIIVCINIYNAIRFGMAL